MPRIIPEPRYFSTPSTELGADVLRNRALNCWPCVRSLVHSPDAVIHSPAEMMAACPTTVTISRWPRAFALRTDIMRAAKQLGLWADGEIFLPESDQAVEMLCDIALFEPNQRGRRAFDVFLAAKAQKLDAADFE